MVGSANGYGYGNVHEYTIHEQGMCGNEILVLQLMNDDDHSEQVIHGCDKLPDYVNGLFLQCDDQPRGLCNVEYDVVDDERLWWCDEQDLPYV